MSKFFSAREMACKCPKDCGADGTQMDRTLMAKLDLIRERFGAPLYVTSGQRCHEWNKKVGGSVGSFHTSYNGWRACDIACTSSRDRYLLIRYAIEVGGLSIGVNKAFLHFDTRPTLSPIIFTY